MNNNKKINEYKKIVEFLGSVLGNNYEIILHIIISDKVYVEKIINGHISGRSEKSPLTGLALDFIEEEIYKNCNFVTSYKGISRNGRELVGSTFFIKGDKEELIGMLCINTDKNLYKELAEKILFLGNFSNVNLNLENEKFDKDEGNIIEIFTESIGDMVREIVDPTLLREDIVLKQDQKVNIINELKQRGIFNMKGAVTEVADILHVSEPSIYRYLKIIEKREGNT